MSAIGDPVPVAIRVLLRVEYADGQIREFEADRPDALKLEISRPNWPQISPERALEFPAGDVFSVSLGFTRNGDPRKHPMTLRHYASGERVMVTPDELSDEARKARKLADAMTEMAARLPPGAAELIAGMPVDVALHKLGWTGELPAPVTAERPKLEWLAAHGTYMTDEEKRRLGELRAALTAGLSQPGDPA
jgi:hypothetical protein